MGKRFRSCCAGIYPPTFFFPDPAESIPPVYAGRGRRGNININNINININNMMAFSMGPVPSSRPGGPFNPFGYPPLSDLYPPIYVFNTKYSSDFDGNHMSSIAFVNRQANF